jgi:hypothetical protein
MLRVNTHNEDESCRQRLQISNLGGKPLICRAEFAALAVARPQSTHDEAGKGHIYATIKDAGCLGPIPRDSSRCHLAGNQAPGAIRCNDMEPFE